MTYAKLLSETSISTNPPRSATIDGRPVTGELPADYLATLGYLPYSPADCPTDPAPEGHHYEPRYASDGATVSQSWVEAPDPAPAPRKWTPLSIKRTVAAAGHWDALKTAMESADKFDEFLMAQVIVEDDSSYAAMRSAAVAIAGSEEAADALIDQIPTE